MSGKSLLHSLILHCLHTKADNKYRSVWFKYYSVAKMSYDDNQITIYSVSEKKYSLNLQPFQSTLRLLSTNDDVMTLLLSDGIIHIL